MRSHPRHSDRVQARSNPYEGKKNVLTERQVGKKKRLIREEAPDPACEARQVGAAARLRRLGGAKIKVKMGSGFRRNDGE
ncbi:hypothetical protein ACI2IY_14735 [Lysobacter enzymogenes]|uniref:hypothetical protein n=1 Tax=Lysobacter enzymogenes TaxID=69 RepID=UPI00384CDFEE